MVRIIETPQYFPQYLKRARSLHNRRSQIADEMNTERSLLTRWWKRNTLTISRGQSSSPCSRQTRAEPSSDYSLANLPKRRFFSPSSKFQRVLDTRRRFSSTFHVNWTTCWTRWNDHSVAKGSVVLLPWIIEHPPVISSLLKHARAQSSDHLPLVSSWNLSINVFPPHEEHTAPFRRNYFRITFEGVPRKASP